MALYTMLTCYIIHKNQNSVVSPCLKHSICFCQLLRLSTNESWFSSLYGTTWIFYLLCDRHRKVN